MERETSPIPPKDLRLTAAEENASSQVLEITLEALQTLDQPEEGGMWLMEEGDDSVFYSDEDQTNQHIKSHTSCDFGVTRRRCPMNSLAHEEPIPQREPDQEAEAVIGKTNIEMEKKVSLQFNVTERELQTRESEPVYLSECLQPNCTSADKPNISSETEKEARAALESGTANLSPSDVSNVPSCTALKQMPDDHDRSPGHSARPQPKTSGQTASEHDAFNHLACSKYSTVSYRKIRRGNTRQRIEEFENMVINM